MLRNPSFDPGSDDTVRGLLYHHYRLPVYDETESGLPAIDAPTLKQILRFHPEFAPFLEEMLEFRDAYKIERTYCNGIIKRTDENGRCHHKLKQNGAKTGRASGVDPNMTNISSDTPQADGSVDPNSIKQAFTVPRGQVRCFFDFSQIELRVFAFLAQEPTMIKAFIDGEDLHLRNQIEVFGDHDKKSAKRRIVKELAFGTLYGMTPKGIMGSLNEKVDPKNPKSGAYVSEDEATAWFSQFHRRYPRINEYTNELVERMRRNRPPSFTNMFGRERRIPDLSHWKESWVRSAIRRAIASEIQGTAADVEKATIARLYLLFKERRKQGIYDAKFMNMVHDDNQVDVNIEGAPQCAVDMKMVMENFPQFHPVPIVADGEWSTTTWAEKKPVWGH
jgi:DNA polymerase-1